MRSMTMDVLESFSVADHARVRAVARAVREARNQLIRQEFGGIEINEAIAASNFDFSSSVLPLVMNQTALGFYISAELKEHITKARRANLIVISGAKTDKLDDLEDILERNTVRWIIAAGSLAMAPAISASFTRFSSSECRRTRRLAG